MKLKEYKVKKYYVHYDVERIERPRLTNDAITAKGKIQYKIKLSFIVPDNTGSLINSTLGTMYTQIGGSRMVQKISAIDKNIAETKKIFIDQAKRNGIQDDKLTEIMRIKGFGHEGK